MNNSEPDHYCRNCHHMTKPIGDPAICCWCHSVNIGLGSDILHSKKRPMGNITEPEDTLIRMYDRLVDGFNTLYAAQRME